MTEKEKELEQIIKESEQKTETSFESLKDAARDVGRIGHDAVETERRIEIKRARRKDLLSIALPALIGLAILFGMAELVGLTDWDYPDWVAFVWLGAPVVGVYLSWRRFLNFGKKEQEIRSKYDSKVSEAELLQNSINREVEKKSSFDSNK